MFSNAMSFKAKIKNIDLGNNLTIKTPRLTKTSDKESITVLLFSSQYCLI